ncbi:hypothetical protein [Polaribacter sp. Q13]|uniref:hypothetical protein n=1 Tax=Polaribacter sp. Q13 TaxID=2806551 RepID=UPI00193BE1B8|nr:hypothetical protein [Polaribacter sp. Q13]QVY65783.1 hypothetical protein JOP69_00395 [Polaribacter sp. Q13]
MNKKNILYLFTSFSILTTGAYAILRLFSVFIYPGPRRDEVFFIKAFNVFIDSGFSEANILGNSTFFNCISFLFYKLGLERIMAMRMTSLFFGVLSVFLLWWFVKQNYNYLPKLYRNAIIITSVNAMVLLSFIFKGINDSMLTFFTLLFFIFFFKIKKDNKSIILYASLGGVFALMLSTRLVSILIFPTFILVLAIYFYKLKLNFKSLIFKTGLILISFTAVLMLFNFPSIKEKGKLSFMEKKIEHKNVSWPQVQYLTAIWLEQGKLTYGNHCSPEDVIDYVSKNGSNSLPNSVSETIMFNIPRSIKTSTREAIYLIKPYTRILGLVFVFGMLLFIRGVFKKEITLRKIINNEIAIFFINYNLIIVLIICSYVEPRWFMPVIVLMPVLFFSYFYKYVKSNSKLEFLFFGAHFLFLALMNMKFIVNNYSFMF